MLLLKVSFGEWIICEKKENRFPTNKSINMSQNTKIQLNYHTWSGHKGTPLTLGCSRREQNHFSQEVKCHVTSKRTQNRILSNWVKPIELLMLTGCDICILGSVASVNQTREHCWKVRFTCYGSEYGYIPIWKHQYFDWSICTKNELRTRLVKLIFYHIFLILCSIANPICFWCINALEIFADKTRRSVLEAGNVQKSPRYP